MGAYCQGKMYLGHSENLHKARNRMKQEVSKKRIDKEFNVGDLVYIKLKSYRQMPLAQRTNQKPPAKFLGPYMVKEGIDQVTYGLHLPVGAEIHDVHVYQPKKKKHGNWKMTTSWQEILNEAEGIHARETHRYPGQTTGEKFRKANVKVIVHWSNALLEKASWEFYNVLQKEFPEFCSTNP